MENTTFSTVVSELNQQVNDRVYTNLLDAGINSDDAYQSAFHSSFTLDEADEVEVLENYGPISVSV